MQQICVEGATGNLVEQLWQQVQEARRNRGYVYRTFCRTEDVSYTLVTTSKDTHLELGQLPERALQLLCKLIEHVFSTGGETEILFYMRRSQDAKGVLITQAAGASKSSPVYHLSPAH